MHARTRRLLFGALLALLAAGLLSSGAAHVLHHDHGEAEPACTACLLTTAGPPEPLVPGGALRRVERLPLAPAHGPEALAPTVRLAPRAPPERI